MGTSKSKPKTAVEKALELAATASKTGQAEDYAVAIDALVGLPEGKLPPKMHNFIREHGSDVMTAPGKVQVAITEAQAKADELKAKYAEATGALTTARKGEGTTTRRCALFVYRTIEVHHIMTQSEFVMRYGRSDANPSGPTQGQISRYQLTGRGMVAANRTSDRGAQDLYALAGNQRKDLSAALKVTDKDPAKQADKRRDAVTKLVVGADAAKAKAKAEQAAAKAKARADAELAGSDPGAALVKDATAQAVALTASLRLLAKSTDTLDVKVWRALVEQVDAYNAKAQRAIDAKRQGVSTVKAA